VCVLGGDEGVRMEGEWSRVQVYRGREACAQWECAKKKLYEGPRCEGCKLARDGLKQ
jgi:hypothetical protein